MNKVESEDEEDLRKITEFIDKQKSSNDIYLSSFQLECQDFISFKQFDDEDYEHEEDIFLNAINEDIEVGDNVKIAPHVKTTALTEEERKAIDECEDPALKKILILNRTKNMQLVHLHKKIKDLLYACENILKQKNDALKKIELKLSSKNTQYTNIWKLAAPYFKDKNFYASPLNADAKKKRYSNELSVYEMTPPPKWTTIEFDRLITAVKCNYNINRQNHIKKQLKELQANDSDLEENQAKCHVQEIITLTEELQRLKEETEVPPLNSNEFINWYKVSEIFLKDKRSALECESVWHILIHPSINKTNWTDEENKKLEELVKVHKNQDWSSIASELQTNRTGFTCCLHYFSKLHDKFKKNKFTPEEDKLLMNVINMYRVGTYIPWNKVACHFNDRTRHQLYHRFTYFLSKQHVKRGKFSEAEDILLLVLVNKFGRNFKKCAEYMPHRSQIQLKSRYNSNLQRNIKKGCFSVDDDEMLYSHVQKYGTKDWVSISGKLNRCGAQIRQRYRLIKNFLDQNPDAKIYDIPRKKGTVDQKCDIQYAFLKFMAEQFKESETIPTLQVIEESLQDEIKINMMKDQKKIENGNKSKQNNKQNLPVVKGIDNVLTEFFASSLNVRQNKFLSISNAYLNEAAENVMDILSVLKVNLSELPTNIEASSHLDDVDVAILERLSNKNVQNSGRIDQFLPPNFSTIVGLRSLLIKHKEYKSERKCQTWDSGNMKWSMDQYLSNLDESQKIEIESHRSLFSERFNSLFNWAAVMSLEKPNFTENKCEEPRPNKREASSTLGPITKKIKVNASMLEKISQCQTSNSIPKSHLVDKSVVDKLINSNRKLNIIKLDTIIGIDGVVRPILKKSA